MKGTFKKMFLVLAGVMTISPLTQIANAQSIPVWSGSDLIAKVVVESHLVCLNSTVSERLSSILDRDPYCCSQRNDSEMLTCLQAHVQKAREYSSFVWGMNGEFFGSGAPNKNDLDDDNDTLTVDNDGNPVKVRTVDFLQTQIRNEKTRLTNVIAYFNEAFEYLGSRVQRR